MRIWTGRAGSGKTTAILREIAALSEKGAGRQILLVPELNSHLMERRLAAATHNHGARTAEVLTFSRLADRVFSEVGGLAQQMLTPAGQLLTLQEAARRVQGGLSASSAGITSILPLSLTRFTVSGRRSIASMICLRERSTARSSKYSPTR